MVHVAVIGAGGGIGQPLSLLLTLNLPPRSTLSLYDLVGAAGVAADLSHIDRDITIHHGTGQLPPRQKDPALTRIAQGVDVFVVVAGIARKPGMTRDDLFKINAGVVLDTVQTCAAVSPHATFCIVTNPVNSVVPIAALTLKKMGLYNKDKLFGVSTLDCVRAARFLNDERSTYKLQGGTVGGPAVPVIGGHSDVSIVPLFSHVASGPTIADPARLKVISERVQCAGTEVVKAKAGRGSATLSMAYSAAYFALAVCKGLAGEGTLVYSYVDTAASCHFANAKDGVALAKLPEFFAIPVLLGTGGIEARYDPRLFQGTAPGPNKAFGSLSELEAEQLATAMKIVNKNIDAGATFARSKL